MTTLLLFVPDGYRLDGDDVILSAKTAAGIEAFAEQWPGELLVWGPPGEHADAPPNTRRRSAELTWSIAPGASLVEAARADLIHAILRPATEGLVQWDPGRVVLLVENSLSEDARLATVGGDRLTRLRARRGALRRFPATKRALAGAAGVQCNGYGAWTAYGRLNPNSIRFLDHRVPTSLIAESTPKALRSDQPLRLGFSGRHTPEKGPHDALRLAAELDARGIAHTLTMFGGGPLRAQLERDAGAGVSFRGMLDFDTQWVPEVRCGIDLMVLLHPQGDPSGTYLEAAALAVPTLGYANVALRGLVEHGGIGWHVSIGDVSALADRVQALVEQPEQYAAASERALAFMREHPFEKKFARRIEHLRRTAGV